MRSCGSGVALPDGYKVLLEKISNHQQSAKKLFRYSLLILLYETFLHRFLQSKLEIHFLRYPIVL
jgi:hypothetical protein